MTATPAQTAALAAIRANVSTLAGMVGDLPRSWRNSANTALTTISASANALEASLTAATPTPSPTPTPTPTPAPTPTPSPTPTPTPPPASGDAKGVPAGFGLIHRTDWRTEGFGGAWGFANERYRDKAKAGLNGFGFEAFLDPTASGVPADYLAANPLGPFELIPGMGMAFSAHAAPASVLALFKSQGIQGRNVKGALAPPTYVGAYSTTRGKLEAKPPCMIVFHAAVDDIDAGSWSALWGLGGRDGIADKVETDVHEGFAGNYGMNSTMHVDETNYGDGIWMTQGPPVPLAGNLHQYAVVIDATGGRTFMLDGAPIGPTITAKDMGNASGLLETFVPIINQAAGFPWDGGFAPKRALKMIVQRVEVFAPSAVGSILPASPVVRPDPVGAYVSTLAANTAVGAPIATLTGGYSYSLIDATGSLKITGAGIVVAKPLKAGPLAFVVKAVAGDGTVSYGPVVRVSVA